ncbi:MAG TPA: ABC transporter ATP-binding protein [Gemmataceae bacterium]|nr:ABC transporter ATP-binding protein [Gemmataceae bacterium]
MSDPAAPVLEARNLSKSYRRGATEVRALTDVSLTIPAGSFILLTGPSGSGKTTLLALLAALDRPSSGTVLFAGRDLSAHSDVGLARVRRRLGFIAQDFALIPGLSAWENVTYPLIPRGVRRAERRGVAAELLTRLGLLDRLNARPRELSGGEQQRVAVARALAGRAEVVLADEPTSNLDEATARGVIELLAEVHRDGRTVVVATHDPRLTALATAKYELAAGRLVTG